MATGTKIIDGSKFLFGTSNTAQNKVYGYLRVQYNIDEENRKVTYDVDLGTEYYYTGNWAWGPSNKGTTSLKVAGKEQLNNAKVGFVKTNTGYTTIHGGSVAPCWGAFTGPYTAYYDDKGKASTTLSFSLSAKNIYNTAVGKYYDIVTSLSNYTLNFPDIPPVAAEITEIPTEWSLESTLPLKIKNNGEISFDLKIFCNGVLFVEREDCEVVESIYNLDVTPEERKRFYSGAPDPSKAEFIIIIISHVATNKTVEKQYSLNVVYATKTWVKVEGTWKRAFVWARINGEWKQCFPWVKINDSWKQV